MKGVAQEETGLSIKQFVARKKLIVQITLQFISVCHFIGFTYKIY